MKATAKLPVNAQPKAQIEANFANSSTELFLGYENPIEKKTKSAIAKSAINR